LTCNLGELCWGASDGGHQTYCRKESDMSKLIVQKVQTHTDGSLKDHQYGIGDVGLVLEILRNKLYKDPILAVVREYVTNARDAHVEVGKSDIPVIVHLPSYDDMYFKVQDFGPGLSPERIEKIFCNYASSTKRDSDDQVGYFGIGSKSAFAYSDSFTITSVVDGKIRTYTSYIDESRRGKISCLYEADTDQPNGTTIIIPVKKYDPERFFEKLRFVTEFWKVRPTVFKGGEEYNITYSNEKTVFSGNDWHLARNTDYDFRGTHAIMGGIPYAIDIHNHFDSHPARNFFSYSCVRIHFNNSDLSLAASRDSLHYDARTIKAIRDKLDSIIDEINSRISEQIANELTYRDAFIKYNTALDAVPELSKIIDAVNYDSNPVYRNPKISMFGSEARLTWYSKVTLANGFKDIKTKTVNYKNPSADADFANILSRGDATIVFNDLASSDLKKYAIKLLSDSSGLNHVVIMTVGDSKESIAEHKYLWFAQEICYAKISEITPDKVIRYTNRKSLSDKKNLFVYKFDHSSSRADHGRSLVEASPSEDIVYFFYDLKANKPINVSSQTMSYLRDLQNALGVKIYGVASSKTDKVPSNWTHINVAVNQKFDEYKAHFGLNSLQDYLESMAVYEKISNSKFSRLLEIFSKHLSSDNLIGTYLRKCKAAQSKYSAVWNHSSMSILAKHLNDYSYYDSTSLIKSFEYDYDKFFENLIRQYPMIKFFPISYYNTDSSDFEKVNSYVEMMDKLNNSSHSCVGASMCA